MVEQSRIEPDEKKSATKYPYKNLEQEGQLGAGMESEQDDDRMDGKNEDETADSVNVR